MSFLFDKAYEAGKRISNIGRHELTADEKAREARYADSAKKYKRIVLKWLYEDKVPIEQLKRLGLWKPELMDVNIAAMGGGPGVPGVPLVPVLTSGSSRPVSVTSEAEAKSFEEQMREVYEWEAAIKASREEAKSQGREAPAVSEIMADPRNYEGGPQGQNPTLTTGPGGVTGAYLPATSSSSPPALRRDPRPMYFQFPPGRGSTRETAMKKLREEAKAGGRQAVFLQSNEIRDAVITAIAKKRGAVRVPAGETHTELKKKFQKAWTAAATSGGVQEIMRELGDMGLFDGDTSSLGVAERIASLGLTEQRRILASVFQRLGLVPTYLVDVPQTGPGYDVEVETKSADDPLAFAIENKDNIVSGLMRWGWDPALAESAFEALVATSVRYSQQDIASGEKPDTVKNRRAARRDAVNYLVEQLAKLQSINSMYELSNAPTDYAELARMALNMVPFFAKALRGGAISDGFNRAQEIIQGLRSERAEADRLMADPMAIARLQEVASEVGLELKVDEKEIASLDADRGVINAITQAVMSQRREGSILKRGSFMIYKVTGGRAGSRPPQVDDGDDGEEISWYDADDGIDDDDRLDDDDDPPGGGGDPPGGGGGEPPNDPSGSYIIRFRGRQWKLKNILSALAAILSIGVSSNELRKMAKDLKDKGVASTKIGPDETQDMPAEPGSRVPQTDHTYELAADGKPKLFPGYETASNLASTDAYVRPGKVPAGKTVPGFKLTVPELAPPPAGAPKMSDYTRGFDTENVTIQDMIEERPELGSMIEDYNINVSAYNRAKEKGDKMAANELYNKLRVRSAEIANFSRTPYSREGVNALTAPPLEYDAHDSFGNPISLKHFRTKTARTAALGLDDEIDRFNEVVMQLNDIAYSGGEPTMSRTGEYIQTKAEYDSLVAKMSQVEGSPWSAQGTVKPKLVEEQYPKRVQEIAQMAFDNKRFTLSPSDIELLERYPAVGKPLIEYAKFKQDNPDTKLTANSIQRKLDAIKAQGFKLQPSARPFAEGLHTYPKSVQQVIDRIAASDGRTPVPINERERAAIAEYPELEARVRRYEDEVKSAPKQIPTRGGRVFEAVTQADVASDRTVEEFRAIKANGYKGVEPVSSSVAEVEAQMAQDRANLQKISRSLRAAIDRNAPRSLINELYAQQNGLRARLAAERADIAGRGTYLGDVSRERLPTNDAELKAFQRLQNVEQEFQGRQDALFEYNEEERALDYTGMSRTQMYEARLALLKTIANRQGLASVYESAVNLDVDAVEEDEDTVVKLPDDPNASAEQGSGEARAEMIDPNEREMFLQSTAEGKRDLDTFLKFSYVPPGFGLGGPRYNPLQRAWAQSEAKRFASVTMPPASQQLMHRPRPARNPGNPQRQPLFRSVHQVDFGDVHFEDAYHNNYQRGGQPIFTNAYQDTLDRSVWFSPQNIYQPDMAGYAYAQKRGTPEGEHPVIIGEVSRPAEYRGTNLRFHQTNGLNTALQNRAWGFPADGGRTMVVTGISGREDEIESGMALTLRSAPPASVYESLVAEMRSRPARRK